MKILFVVLMCVLTSQAQDRKPDQWINLYPDGAPLPDGTVEEVQVPILLYRAPKAKATGAAMVICPGGGYGGLVKQSEGKKIALWLNEHGITGIVLEYRLPKGRAEVPLMDAQAALRHARKHAAEWGINKDRIGIIGFSAGGHLAATAATLYTDAATRPSFAVLVYPVISMEKYGHGGSKRNLLGRMPKQDLVDRFSPIKQVTDRTPPVYLAHAVDDKPVPVENSRLLHEALKDHRVKTKYLELPSGGHGLNGYKGPNWDAWQRESIAWIGELFK